LVVIQSRSLPMARRSVVTGRRSCCGPRPWRSAVDPELKRLPRRTKGEVVPATVVLHVRQDEGILNVVIEIIATTTMNRVVANEHVDLLRPLAEVSDRIVAERQRRLEPAGEV